MESEFSPYREVIDLPGWLWLSFALVAALLSLMYFGLHEVVRDEDASLIWLWNATWLPAIAACAVLPLLLARLEIHVDRDWITLRFGLLGLVRTHIPRRLIEHIEPLSYRPIRQFGGWGIRWGYLKGTWTTAYSMRGSTGVLLVLHTPIRAAFLRTNQVLIGTRHPACLAAMLGRATVGAPTDACRTHQSERGEASGA